MIEKVIAVVSHADDAEIWSGGTLLNFRNQGSKIAVCYMDCYDEIRKQEGIQASKKLTAGAVFFDRNNRVKSLRNFIVEFKPSIILTHWEGDTHPEHVNVFADVVKILPNLVVEDNLAPNVFACDCYNSFGRNQFGLFLPTDYIDISDVWEEKLDLISTYKTQPVEYWKSMAESQNRLHGSRVGVRFAEGFIQIPVLGVVRRSNDLLKGN